MIGGIDSQFNTYTPAAKGGDTMDKDAFLSLMIAQLQNQDPMNPMDGTEYAAQLAQFTSLEQLTNLNTSMNKSIDANYYLTQSINNTLTATLIGNDVKLASPSLQNVGQDSVSIGYKLPSDSSNVKISIYNESGALIRTIEQENISGGDHKLSWDFSDNNGTKVPKGKYTFKVTATDNKGDDLVVSTYGVGTIDAVRFSENGTTLVVDGVEYNLSDIMEILNNSSEGDG
ncbi:MAG: flagellar hook capping protein [Ignavibacteriales bacterium CG18_big_fil_WC_8_21_14_2_50_31_20]|nr:MAG: flagellar hook capping protein [Ignavibacteriales bacterium CG18_big_fil_WC_8_21_14_2_50_31_20]